MKERIHVLRRVLISVLLAMTAAAALAACGKSGDSPSSSPSSSDAGKGDITLGFAIGKTGFMEAYDGPPFQAAQFAIDDINAKGGVGGRKLKFVSADTKSKAELGGDAATTVLSQGADVVVTSCDFDLGSPAAIVAQGKGKLAFSTCAASTAFGPQGIGPLAYTMATAASAEGATMAEWATKKKGAKSAYVLLDNTIEFTKQSAYGFRNRWKQLGNTIAGEDTFKQDDQSVDSQITRIKGLSQKPDVIFLTSYMPGEAKVLKQIRAAGIDTPILADEDVDGDFWKDAVPDIGDVYYTTYVSIYGDDPDQKVNDLVDRFKQKTGKQPDNGLFITGYAAVQAIAKSIEDAGGKTDGAGLAAKLDTYKDAPFVLPTTYTKELHITTNRTQRVMQIQAGKSTFVEQWKPSQVPLPPAK
jgi:branched-chain amino acid transport system substrate-binding protein